MSIRPTRRGPKSKFNTIHKEIVGRCWELASNICAERLHPMISIYIDQLDIRGMLRLYTKDDIDITRSISLGTLKRVISTFPRTSTKKYKGNASIYKQVPIVAHFGQFTDKPGYVEVDFVEHNGGVSSGLLDTMSQLESPSTKKHQGLSFSNKSVWVDEEGKIQIYIMPYNIDVTTLNDLKNHGLKIDIYDNPRTFFDASFYNFTINDRLIVDDQNLAQRVVNQHIPEFDLVMMIINTPLFGGSGGRVSVFSSHPLSSKIGLDEMGHTAFGLADEYEFPGSNGRIGEIYDGPPRSEPNIATSVERAKGKWGHLIDDLEDMPIFRNPSCSEFSPSPPIQMHGKVGAFEGAFHHHRGIFRPESDCVMRSLSQDSFCRVCSDRIRRIISENI